MASDDFIQNFKITVFLAILTLATYNSSQTCFRGLLENMDGECCLFKWFSYKLYTQPKSTVILFHGVFKYHKIITKCEKGLFLATWKLECFSMFP